MACASFIRLAGVLSIAWIATQSAAHAQRADEVQGLNSQFVQLCKRTTTLLSRSNKPSRSQARKAQDVAETDLEMI